MLISGRLGGRVWKVMSGPYVVPAPLVARGGSDTAVSPRGRRETAEAGGGRDRPGGGARDDSGVLLPYEVVVPHSKW